MQFKALTNINGHKLNLKCGNFAKENSEMFFFSKNERQRDKFKQNQNFNTEC